MYNNLNEVRKKNIGIITFHKYSNPGTVLQALALQDAVEALGYHAELIDFEARVNRSKWQYLSSHVLRIPIYLRYYEKYYLQKKYNFKIIEKSQLSNAFHDQYLHLGSRKYNSSQELCDNPPVYDGYVVGSDQTWNPNVSNNPDAFYLTFVKEREKCGSYAPSIAVNRLSREQELRAGRLLEHIQWLSCREKQGAEIIRRITGRDTANVLDPTLLLDDRAWRNYEKRYTAPANYILQYILGESKEHREYVKHLSEKLKLPVINISTTYLDWKSGKVSICGPDEFIWLIDNASLVCTDSFHGTAFSVNLNTPFVSFERYKKNKAKSENSRLYDFLSMLGIEKKIVDPGNISADMDYAETDFTTANKKLEDMRRYSLKYLEEMLLSITSYN